LADKIAKKIQEKPNLRTDFAVVVRDKIMPAVQDLRSGSAPLPARGMIGRADFKNVAKGSTLPNWFRMGEVSKLATLWLINNVRWRYQYAIMGDTIALPWSTKRYYDDLRKKRKKRKKVGDVAQLLDIFTIDLEDIFDIDTLGIHEVLDLDDISKTRPSETEYKALKKLMKEEGYFEVSEVITTIQKGYAR